MADRTTKVTFTAQVSGYLSGMDQAAKKTREFADGSKQKLDAQRQAMTTVGTGAIAMGGAIAAGVGFAIKSFADFDAKMSQVQTLSHATAAQMGQLSDAALHMGQQVGFSATQTADAEIELVKAGVSLSDIMGGALKGSLDLAAAGQIDVGQATEIATIALTQFNLQGKDVPHVADLLAAGADKALGGVADLGEALKSGGLVAAQFGVSLDETVGTLSAFANAGLLGETAGTDLRQMLLKLANPSAEAQKALDKLGISIYGANGEFVGMSSLAGQLQDKMGKLEPATRNAALATIFGSRAIAGANVLYKEGAKGIADWTNAVNDAGFAGQQARGKMDNLTGDINKLGAAFQTGLIEAGGSADGVLRGLTQGTTTLVKAVGDLPAPVLGAGLGISSLAAGVLLLGGTALVAVPKIAAMKLAMHELDLTGKSLLGKIGKGGALLIGVAALASAFTNMASTGSLSADKLAQIDAAMGDLSKQNLDKTFHAVGTGLNDGAVGADRFREALNNVASGNFWENAAAPTKFIDGITFGLTHLSDVYKDNEAKFREMGQTLADVGGSDLGKATKGFAQMVKAAGGGHEAIRQLLSQMPEYKAKLIELADAQGITLTEQQLFNVAVGKGQIANDLAAASTAKNAAQISELSGQAVDAEGNISDLADTIDGFGKGALDVSSAERDFQQAIDDASDAVKKNGKTLDDNTQAGRDNGAALDDIARKTLGLASSQAKAGDDTATLTATIQTGRDAFIAAAEAAGKNADEAGKLADSYGLIPKNVQTAIGVTGADDAIQKARALAQILADTPSTKVINIVSNTRSSIARAGGGPIHGPGTGTSDSIHAMVSNGEYITPAAAAAVPANRHALDYMRAGGVIPGFRSGGSVGAAEDSLALWKQRLAAAKQLTNKKARDAAVEEANEKIAKASSRLLTLKDDHYAFSMDYKWGGQDPAENTSSLVSQLVGMSKDSALYGTATRKAFRDTAATTQVALTKLEAQSTKAADAVSKASDKLGDLKSSSESMVSSIAQALSSRVSDAFTEGTSKEVWKKQGNLSWAQTVTTGGGATASGVASFYKAQAAGVAAFAAKLKKLAAKGVNPALLAEIAGLGVDQGTQMADALLSASTSQIKSVNSDYAAIGKSALAAGNTVADANYKALIDSAQKALTAADKNADKITAAIKTQADKLASVIGKALGVKGFAGGGTVSGIGTSKSDSNLHWLSMGEEVVQEPYASQARPLLKAINAGKMGGRVPTYVRSTPGSYAQSAGGAGQPVIVQLEFKDAALRQMVQVEVKQNDDRNLVTLDVM